MKSLHSQLLRLRGPPQGAFTAGSMSSWQTCALRPILDFMAVEVGGAGLRGGRFCEIEMAVGFLHMALTQPFARSYSWKQRTEV